MSEISLKKWAMLGGMHNNKLTKILIAGFWHYYSKTPLCPYHHKTKTL